jgi:ABC-2 type transport system permease protein
MLDSLLRILSLTRKELLAVLKDPRGRFTILVPPIMQCLIFGYAATFDLADVPYVVLDQDRSAASQRLLADLDGSGVFRRVANLDRETDLKRYVDEREALVALQIPQDFERRLLVDPPVDVQFIVDGRNSNTAATAAGYANTIIERFNADWRVTYGQAGLPLQLTMRAWYNPNLESRWFMIPALIGLLTMIQVMLLTAMSVAREREQGTFDQLLVTPFRPVEIMAGKALPSVLIGLTQTTGILLVAQLWFQIPFIGSFVTLYVGLTIYLLAAVGFGLLISSLVATMQQAMLFSFMLMMPFSLLSGLMTPISSMPVVLQYVTLINPLRYAIEIAHRVYLEGVGLHALWPDIWPLAAIAAVTLSVSAWRFGNRLA